MTDTDTLDATFRLALCQRTRISSRPHLATQRAGISVGHVELMAGIEEAFGIAIDADDVFKMRTT